jgi:hypothetical protein
MHCQVWRDNLVQEESRAVRSIDNVVKLQFVEAMLRTAKLATTE